LRFSFPESARAAPPRGAERFCVGVKAIRRFGRFVDNKGNQETVVNGSLLDANAVPARLTTGLRKTRRASCVAHFGRRGARRRKMADRLLTQACHGAVAGFVATAPMTLFMELASGKEVEERDGEPLSPREITDRALGAANETSRRVFTVLSHFGFGTSNAALFPVLARAAGLPPVAGGIGYGLAVWAGSYLGWLPAVGLHPPATRDSPRRQAVMIAAHVVWGAALGGMAALLERERRNR